MSEEENVKPNRTTLLVMLFLIVMFLTGIIIRWDYIQTEIVETWRNMFSGA